MKAYIIHVSNAYDREKHMVAQLMNKKLNFSFILHGDKAELTEDVLRKYFSGKMKDVSAMASCAYKHFLAYEDMIANNINYALILEDDIYLNKRFDTGLENICIEMQSDHLSNFIISLEDSNLKYVRGSIRKKGKFVYRNKYNRMAGAYIIDLNAAKSMLSELERNRCYLPVDWFHNHCSDQGIIDVYWAHPTLATQGSLNGKIKSMIDSKPSSVYRIVSFHVQRVYKKLLWRMM